MRSTLISLAVAAAAITGATTASQAHYRSYGGYGGYSNDSYGYQQTYYQPHYCRTVTFRVYDEYACEYVYRTKQICD